MISKRPGSRLICTLDAETWAIWLRLKNAVRRGDRRLAKKADAALERCGRKQRSTT